MQVKPFAPMEKALQALILNVAFPDQAAGLVGRDLPGKVKDFYIRIQRVAGSSDRLQGDFVFDVEVFSPSYVKAESASMVIEALLLGYPRTVKVGDHNVVFDRVTQNLGPSEIFWDDDGVHRLLATYVITARR